MSKSDIKPFLFFLFYSMVLVIPFIGSYNLFDWDEINFAESSREMLVSSNFFQVMVNFEPFHEKPPLYFWLQALSMNYFGVGSFAARLPNAVLSILVPFILFKIGSNLKNKTFGWIWSIIFLSGLLPNLYFRSGIIDPYFNLFIFLAIYYFYLSIYFKYTLNIFFSGLFSGLAILTKGPVGLLIVILSCSIFLLLNKKYLSSKQIIYFILPLIIVSSPWYLFELVHKGPWFMVEFVQYQLELFSHPVAGHKQPLYYHFLVVLIGCIPFSFLGLRNAFKDSGSEIIFEKLMRILLWTVLILFTIVTTKIIHYSSMSYIPLSFLAAVETYKIFMGKNLKRVLKIPLVILSSCMGLFLAIILYLLTYKIDTISSFITDSNVKDVLNVKLFWQGWEWIIPLILVAASVIWLIKINTNIIKYLASFSILISLTFALIGHYIVPKIEMAIQGNAIKFYEDISDEKKYITTVGFKSYAHYFYSRIDELDSSDQLYITKSEILNNYFSSSSLNDLNRNEKNKFNGYVLNWLINGKIDRTAYFVTKKSRPIKQLEKSKNLKLVKQTANYQFYKREIK